MPVSAQPAVATLLLFAAAAAHAASTELTDLPGVTATANTCYLQSDCTAPGPFSALNAIDNQPYAYSTGAGGWSAGNWAGASGNWLRIDFGAVYDFESIRIDGIVTTVRSWPGFTNHFVLSTSLDGISWQPVADGGWADVLNDPAQSSASFSFAPGAQPFGRFLEYRVIGAMPGTNEHWSAVSEINAMGTLHVAAVPEPGQWLLLAAGLGAMALRLGRRQFR